MSEIEKKYPYEIDCAECGKKIFVQISTRTNREYATNTIKRNDLHQCYKWRPNKKPQTEPRPEPRKIQAVESNGPAYESLPIVQEEANYDAVFEKLGASLKTLSMTRTKKVWGGSKERGQTDEFSFGVEVNFDPNLEVSPQAAAEATAAYITRVINKQLSISE